MFQSLKCPRLDGETRMRSGLSAISLALLIIVTTSACADVATDSMHPPRPASKPAEIVSSGYKVIEVATGLDHPWSMAFLPDGSMLVTERAGRLRLIKDGKLQPQPIGGVPLVHTGSQGGLFDVVIHPKFAEYNLVYLIYAHGTNVANSTCVARARLDGAELQNLRVIFEVAPLKDTNDHYGGRLAFLPDGTFVLTVGEGFEYREKAQDLSSDLGKIVRLNDDGSVPRDNPFVGQKNARPEILSRGHRNPQGLAFDVVSGRLFETEHGPKGGDELNIIAPGKNYGWPIVTYGMDYSGAYVSPYIERPGLEQPVVQWTPSIGPSGLTIYRGERFPSWNGSILVGALTFKHLRRVVIADNGQVTSEEQLLTDLNYRIRDVRVAPDGYVYVTTDDSPGRVLRLEPTP